MIYSFYLLLLCGSLCGCFATAGHVDKTEKLSVELFDHILTGDQAAQPVLRELQLHVEKGSSLEIPVKAVSALADGLVPGLGLLITTAMGFYAKRKHNETAHVTRKSVIAAGEKNPEKALADLANDPNVRGYNG
tara:strand:- start:193 stop:594 length:402 start_codon:yes stop_codon:yes gene_type:complete